MINTQDAKTIYIHDENLSDTDRALLRIKKMLNLKEGAATEGEATAAAIALQRELVKHNLELSDVEFVKITTDEPVDALTVLPSDYGFKRSKRRIAWIENLANVIAKAHFCKIYVHSGSNTISFVGRKSNRDVAIKAFGYLANIATELADAEANEYKSGFQRKYDWEVPDTKGFKSSFLRGFVSRLETRFLQQRREIEEEAEEAARREAEEKRRVIIDQMLEQRAAEINGRVDALFETVEDDADTSIVDELFEQAENELREILEKEVPLEAVESQALMRLDTEREAVQDWFGERKWGKASATRTSSHNSSGWQRGNTRGGQVSLSGNVLR